MIWVNVLAAYFLLRQRWLRWLGMGTAVYLYLSVVTYLVLYFPGIRLSGAIFYVAVIWVMTAFAFLVGLLLDRSIVPRAGLAA